MSRSLIQSGTVALQGVRGRIDHLEFDNKRHFLYVAALGNNSVEVVDMKAGKVVHSINGLDEPQGIRYIPEKDEIFVANGNTGECDIFNAGNYQKVSSIQLTGDADNVRYDPAKSRIYVGYGEGGIAIIDAATLTMNGDIKLPGHPESFQVDTRSNRIYVNVPDALKVFLIDADKRSVVAEWKLKDARNNFPMAYDPEDHRLFIGCRNPSQLLVLENETGEILSSVSIDGDTDDVFYDTSSKQVFVSCGAGYVDVVRQGGEKKYEVISRIKTRPGARTSLFIPELNKLVVAAPARPGLEAELLLYDLK